MAARECPHEAAVLEALQTSAWPDCCGAALRAHVSSCDSCAGLVAIVTPLLDEHRAAVGEAVVPSSATMWWRMRLRARREAAEAAMRPISLWQGLALAAGAGLLVSIVGAASPAFRQMAAWLAPADVQFASPVGIAITLAIALVAVVTPLAIYFAVTDD